MTLRLALYKGPAQDLAHKIAHWAVCLFTGSPYSHCELVINGVCRSASARDGGVRGKVIDLHSGKWDVVELDEAFSAELAIAPGWKRRPRPFARRAASLRRRRTCVQRSGIELDREPSGSP
jgi:hypothetical protein